MAGTASLRLIEEASDEDIAGTMATNLLGPIYTSRAAIPLLRKGGGGDIVNVSSESTLDPFPFLTLYNTSKGGLDVFTKAFGPNHRFLATVLINEGHLYEHQRRYAEADEAYKRALVGIRSLKRGKAPIKPSDPFLLRDVATVLLDCGLRSALVANQTLITSVAPVARSRVNTVFGAHIWGGNAVGAFLASTALAHWGWLAVCAIAVSASCLALSVQWRSRPARGVS